jgi:hypothetical protein
MTRLTVDNSMRAKLASSKEPLELCDEAGHVLGFFHPVALESDYENYEPPITEEEIARLARQRGGRKLAEIMADLEKRS